MNLLLGVLVIGAVGFFLKFLAAVRKEEKASPPPRPVRVYIVRGGHKTTGRRYGKLTVIDGGTVAQMLACPPVEAWPTLPLQGPGVGKGTLRQR